jgi:hypothetical protein
MSRASVLSTVMAVVLTGLLAWHFASDRRHLSAPDMRTRRRRYKLAWEVRGLVLIVAGPYAAGMLLGYVSPDYALALMLFSAAGFLAAEMIAPSGLDVHR